MNQSVAEIFRADQIESERVTAMHEIERKANHLKDDAGQLVHYSIILASLPEYETNAEAAVLEAVAALQEGFRKAADAYSTIIAKREKKK